MSQLPACVSFARALLMGPPPAGNLAVPVFAHGSLVVELYTPTRQDPQVSHDRDEIYVVARGTGSFSIGADRCAVETGTFIFVNAGQPHHFDTFSEDFAVWVFFYGPKGGEAPPATDAEPGS